MMLSVRPSLRLITQRVLLATLAIAVGRYVVEARGGEGKNAGRGGLAGRLVGPDLNVDRLG